MREETKISTEIGLLTAFITITGAIKLPGLFPGTEFQLSAPLAVAICAVFGFKKYIIAGVLSSLIGLMLGTQNLFNVFIACIFRIVAGGMVSLGGKNIWILSIAGPIGSAVSRLSMGLFLGKAVIPLLLATVPGMIYTAVLAYPLTKVLSKVKLPKGAKKIDAV